MIVVTPAERFRRSWDVVLSGKGYQHKTLQDKKSQAEFRTRKEDKAAFGEHKVA